MVKEERFAHIIRTIQQIHSVSYQLLARQLEVSEDTIRRDIELLHRNGLLTKVRGGAMLRSITPLSFQDRALNHTEGKNIIALKAQSLLKKGQTLFMDGGTTVCALATHFPLDASFTILTNNQALVPILHQFQGIKLILLGGHYNRDTQTTLGLQTCQQLERYVADLYLMGTCGLDSRFGITASVPEDGEVMQVMHQAALRTVALCSQEKLGTINYYRVFRLEDIDVLVTDLASNDAKLYPYPNADMAIY